ncbi:DnaJ-domain-containing protein [Ganoderma leucocontextum]|nr:DnaJ-domain-containing protein [Ganoderma leucocontextum]
MPSADVNPYELLELPVGATEQEINTAYRQMSLKVHPDRNCGNPDAARKFLELQQAQERLLDPLQRTSLDAELRSREALKARYANYDAKRKRLVKELEEREREPEKARVRKEAENKRQRENQRIMEEGRQLREQRERELQKRGQEREALQQKAQQETNAGVGPPPSGPLDTTVRVKWTLSSRLALVDAASIAAVLTPFGAIDKSSIVLSPKLTAPKKPKRRTALVPFTEIGAAFAAVCASGRAEHGLQDIEVTWAGGAEPELIGWLKKTSQLGGTANGRPPPSPHGVSSTPTPGLATPASEDAFSSSLSTFPDLDAAPQWPSAPTAVPGLDYESVTLTRMRHWAERERLAHEIREQEAAEGEWRSV